MHFSNLLGSQTVEQYVPRVYGFKVHSSSVIHRKTRMQLTDGEHTNGKANGSATKKTDGIEKKHDGNLGNSAMPDAKRCKRDV